MKTKAAFLSILCLGFLSGLYAQPGRNPTIAPPVPTGLNMIVADSQILLSWAPSPGATIYNIKRATVSGGPYTNVNIVRTPSVVDTGLTDGTTYYYVVSAQNLAGESPNSNELIGQPSAPPPSALPTTTQLPLEAIGQDGTIATASFPVPAVASLSGPPQLWMQIHGLRTETQASVKINNSDWTPITSKTVRILGLASAYGGIGGGFHTLTMAMSLPAGAVVGWSNTISFRFDGTDGRVSGFRVLAFTIQNSVGTSLIPSSTFANDDPNTWQPPSTNSSDIIAGQTLWQQAALTTPTPFGPQAIKAHCSDCHAQDGRDLKYFNYSNNAIRTRALFHGLTAQQGDQIASYIRTLNTPNPGRPWNPPYQPGPGLDSQPVQQWSAGAGLSAVLSSDQEMMNAMFPGGIQSSYFSPNGTVSVRETSIPLQLPDWNSWLPMIHPMDAWPDFVASSFFSRYGLIRSQLVPGSPTAYQGAIDNLRQWDGDRYQFISPKIPAANSSMWTPTFVNQVYSTQLWALVKSWEINHEFGLEDMAKAVFTNPKAEPRSWLTEFPFVTSPNIAHIPAGIAGLDNGSIRTWTYLSFIWYQVELILNNSEYAQEGNSPIDWQYVYGFIVNMSAQNSYPQASMFTLWLTKALQISNNGIAPNPVPNTTGTGFNWLIPDISELVAPGTRSIWGTTSPYQRTAIHSGMVQAWLDEVQMFTPQQYYAAGINGAALPTHGQPNSMQWQDRIWYMIPQFRFYGVSQSLINQMAAWAQTIWPNASWADTTTAICVSDGVVTPGPLVHCSTEY